MQTEPKPTSKRWLIRHYWSAPGYPDRVGISYQVVEVDQPITEEEVYLHHSSPPELPTGLTDVASVLEGDPPAGSWKELRASDDPFCPDEVAGGQFECSTCLERPVVATLVEKMARKQALLDAAKWADEEASYRRKSGGSHAANVLEWVADKLRKRALYTPEATEGDTPR